jgi:hypothetical protein
MRCSESGLALSFQFTPPVGRVAELGRATVCFNGKLDSGSSCASSCFQPDGFYKYDTPTELRFCRSARA